MPGRLESMPHGHGGESRARVARGPLRGACAHAAPGASWRWSPACGTPRPQRGLKGNGEALNDGPASP